MAYLEIPYFNELTANQLGFSTEFDSNTPLSYVGYSLQSLGRFFQNQQPRIRSTRDWEEALRNMPGQSPTTAPTSDCPQGQVKVRNLYDIITGGYHCVPEDSIVRHDGQHAPLGDDPTDSGAKADELITSLGGSKDVVITLGILFLALIIFVLAVK